MNMFVEMGEARDRALTQLHITSLSEHLRVEMGEARDRAWYNPFLVVKFLNNS